MAHYWPAVYGPQCRPAGAASAHINLAVDAADGVWEIVSENTRSGRLGYMVSHSDNPMEYGRLQGKWTVTVHFLSEDEGKVRARLNELNLSDLEF